MFRREALFRKLLYVFAVSVVALSGVACATSVRGQSIVTPTPIPNPKASDHDPNAPEVRKVEVDVGDWYELSLEGNPTTGYQWSVFEVTGSALSPKCEDAYVEGKDANGQALLGAGGAYTFRFYAVEKGESTVRLMYRRPWEQNVEPLKVVLLQVTVR